MLANATDEFLGLAAGIALEAKCALDFGSESGLPDAEDDLGLFVGLGEVKLENRLKGFIQNAYKRVRRVTK